MFWALLFNVCCIVLPITATAAFFVIERDNLYAYELSPSGQRAVSARVERLAAEMIHLDFDRLNQWDDLVAMELMNGDIAAARGYLLSARNMLPAREANLVERRVRSNSSDADVEAAALELLSPGTRSRYEATVPLLGRRAASGALAPHPQAPPAALGDQRDFEILARAIVSDGQSDPMHFVLTGLGLGLGGDFTPRMQAGAAALIAAERHEEFSGDLANEFTALTQAAVPNAQFRTIATAEHEGDAASAYANAAAAYRASISPERMEALKTALDEIGMMSEATSVAGAAIILTHARSLRDVPRLRLVAQAAGDRAVAVAKGLSRDGRLARTARGSLTMNAQLMLFAGAAVLALLALTALTGFGAYFVIQDALAQFGFGQREDFDIEIDTDESAGELVHTFNDGRTWRPL